MKPIDVKESNSTLTKPQALTDQECGSLKVWTDQRQCISCWEPSFRERLSILFNGKIWLSIHSGMTQPPVWIDGAKTVFEQQGIKVKIANCSERIISLFNKKLV